MNDAILILNENVKATLLAKPEICPAFFALHGGYDSDIDALHNPDRVNTFKVQEEKKLLLAEEAYKRSSSFLRANKDKLLLNIKL